MGFLLRNWHLKLSAVALSTVLYTGLVFSGSLPESRLELPVRTTGQPEPRRRLTFVGLSRLYADESEIRFGGCHSTPWRPDSSNRDDAPLNSP